MIWFWLLLSFVVPLLFLLLAGWMVDRASRSLRRERAKIQPGWKD